MEDIIRERIASLESSLEKVRAQIKPDSRKVLDYVVEAERLKFAITQLYICLGSKK